MNIKGSIKNSKTGSPVKGAKIELNIDNRENYLILSDEMGRFEYQTEGMHRMLYINIERDGFEAKSLTYQMDKPELQMSVLLDEIPVPAVPEPPEIIEDAREPVQHEKTWNIQKDFLSTNAFIVTRFLIEQIEEYIKKRGENEEIEAYKKNIETYKEKTEFLQKELDEYEDIIKKLEGMLGSEYISENAFVNWNLEKIKPNRFAFKIDLWVEKSYNKFTGNILKVKKPEDIYQIGEKIDLYFRSEKDCYLFLMNYGTSGRLSVLFPNAFFKDNSIKGNRIYAIPGEDYPFDYIISGPTGIEKVKAIATTHKLDLIDLNFKRGEIFSLPKLATRDISVAAKKEGRAQLEWAEAICEIRVE